MGETSTKKVFTDYFRNEKDIKVVAQKKKPYKFIAEMTG